MIVQAELSLYPLRTEALGTVIDLFGEILALHHVTCEPGTMSTHIIGENAAVFAAIAAAYEVVAAQYQSVLLVKLSNACPIRETPLSPASACG